MVCKCMQPDNNDGSSAYGAAAQEKTWHRHRSTYLLGWNASSWMATRLPRGNGSYCQRRSRLGWLYGPTKTCPRCDEREGSGVCPAPGSLADFLRSFEHVFVMCEGHRCARHISGYWPLNVSIKPFDTEDFNRMLAHQLSPPVAHALGLAPQRAASRRAVPSATAHRLLVLLAHLTVVQEAARRGSRNILIMESV